ncbi:ornithine carbamoyltransferase [Fluviispira multicolorata]|uniref:Ornithine carbamoyltransferase n=1 Tax=Fluviispira multicolorata TaxID=2654512 RepID=A0A833JAU6_9BACT|nr:ornithine carbamoyltransferase [Fluviispira multicolorata]KAB8028513.1 ornithine carbamoyltransferase [Fluviispira multicolorata]
MNLTGRSLSTLLDYSVDEINFILELSHKVKKEKKEKIFPKRLANKNIALIFEKSSTRTRSAFTVAAFDEGAHPEFLNKSDIHFGKKESTKDTARVLGRMYDGIMFRGFKQETLNNLIQFSQIPVWNALTDDHHPTQAFADMLTLQEKIGELKGKKLVYLGDAANNVAHSLMIMACKLGMSFVVCSPKSRRPYSEIISQCEKIIKETGAELEFSDNPVRAVKSADCLYTDVWISMGEENNPECKERIEILKPYQINNKLMCATENESTLFLHCLPAVKGMEVTEEVFESKNSGVFDQAENRMHTIKAIMIATLT